MLSADFKSQLSSPQSLPSVIPKDAILIMGALVKNPDNGGFGKEVYHREAAESLAHGD